MGRGKLLAAVPAWSADQGRCRAVIYAAADAILSAGVKSESSNADNNKVFRVSYPEYFAQPGAVADTCVGRARSDVRALLQAVAG